MGFRLERRPAEPEGRSSFCHRTIIPQSFPDGLYSGPSRDRGFENKPPVIVDALGCAPPCFHSPCGFGASLVAMPLAFSFNR
jgi:hypothetical protein